MCATPSPREFDEICSKEHVEEGVEIASQWKWRSPVYALDRSELELDPLNKNQTKRLLGSGDEVRKQIYGIGRNYNKELGVGAFRTGASIKLDCGLSAALAIIRRNIEQAGSDPFSTLRLMVQGDEFWYSDATSDELFEMLVEVGDAHAVKKERRNTSFEEAAPVGVCVCEDLTGLEANGAGACCQATWLFRHDVIDGWRALRYLCGTVLGTKELTLDRLYQRYESKETNAMQKTAESMLGCITPVCFAPVALSKVIQVASVNGRGSRRKFYCHAICGIDRLKAIGKERGTGSLTSTLTACILDAFFTADPSREHANVASNVLFDPTSPDGNHMCIKVACIARRGSTLRKTAQVLRSTGQKVADLWVAAISRKYVLGHMPEKVNAFLDSRQKGLDFLVSSLPAYDRTTPTVLDLKVSREFTQWAPSIVYALGIGENLFLDFYWEVQTSFDDDAFCDRLKELLETTEMHNTLPTAY